LKGHGGGEEVYLHTFLTSTLVNFTLRPLFSWERIPVPAEKYAGWAPEPVVVLDQRKIPCPYRDLDPGLKSIS
jgi:hypothetical protein